MTRHYPLTMSPIAKCLCDFADDLYGQVILSQQAMAMVLAGSKGSTRAQMLKAMKLPATMSDEEVHKSIGPVLKEVFTSTGGVVVSIANRLYVEKTASIESAYTDCVKKHYGAESEQVDFATASANVRKCINGWVSDHTMKKIPELLAEGSVRPDTASVLVNALYFKGQWDRCFDKADTEPGVFTKLDGSKKTVQLMFTRSDFYMLSCLEEEATAIRLPFLKSKWSMLIILPYDHDGLPKILSMLQKPGRLQELLHSKFSQEDIALRVPRFKLTEDVDIDASRVLQRMGMVDVFSKGVADLTGMCKTSKLYISDVRHKAILEVDEEGATAAAATAFLSVSESMPSKLTVQHSFVVSLIYDEHTPVFIGHVTDPEDN